MVAAFHRSHNDEGPGAEGDIHKAARQAERRPRGEDEQQSSKFLNITDPALGKGDAQQDEKWMLFRLEILSPSHIQQIRLRERFKKILTRTKKKKKTCEPREGGRAGGRC